LGADEMKEIDALGSVLAPCLFFAACGGGSNSNNGNLSSTGGNVTITPPITASAEGVYKGTLSNGSSHQKIVLNDGRY